MPQLDYGKVLKDVVLREKLMLRECHLYKETYQCLADSFPTKIAGPTTYSINAMIWTPTRMVDWWALTVCLMVGTASLPNNLMRYFTTPSARVARKNVGWSILFISFLWLSAPTYAIFAKDYIYKNIIGCPIRDLPDWIFVYGEVDLLRVCGFPPKNVQDAIVACARMGYDAGDPLRLADFWMNTDVIIISSTEAYNLPYTVAALTATGGLAASLFTADGMLCAMANSLSRDIYFKVIEPNANPLRRVIISRLFLLAIALLCAFFASTRPADILSIEAWAFSLAAAGNFPALFFGIWWKRTTGIGVIAGMFTGFAVTLFYIIGTNYMDWELWFGVANISAAIFGLPMGILVTVVVSMLTPPPSQETQDLVSGLREPELVRGSYRCEHETQGSPEYRGSLEMGQTNNAARPSYVASSIMKIR